MAFEPPDRPGRDTSRTGAAPAGAVLSGKAHPLLRLLRDRPELAPARELVRELVRELHAAAFPARASDCIAYFQTEGFDEGLFGLFLFAMFESAGHRVALRRGQEGLVLRKDGVAAAVDACIAGRRSAGIQPRIEPAEAGASGRPAQGLGGSLFRCLQRQPWRRPEAAGLPFVVAIQDFDHSELAHGMPPLAVLQFLCGSLNRCGELRELFPDGFFGQPEAENVSGVLFCTDATIAKFNRLGQERHGCEAGRMLRHGACLADGAASPGAAPYVYEVGGADAPREQWNEATVLIHNPFALHPLPADWLGASAELRFVDGRLVEHLDGGFHPLSSCTELLGRDTPAWWIEERIRLLGREHVSQRLTWCDGALACVVVEPMPARARGHRG